MALAEPLEIDITEAPRVYEMLSDAEACLYAILIDHSGLDLAEFTWLNEEEPDGCWRAWPFQWPWWRTHAIKQIDQCARSIGKSESIMARACGFPFVHPGREMVITAPEGIHVDAITDRIETKLTSIRLLREMLAGGRNGIKHKPFHVNFANGSRIMGRIPQKSGIGVKGTHPVSLEMDEGQDYPDKGWTEILETLNRAAEGAEWRVHGVTRGVRDRFYEYTQESPDNDFVVHRLTALHRPTWTEEERESKLKEYGSQHDPDFRRNVYGLHGDATNPIFVLTRFMHCCDQNEGSLYNAEEYHYRRITAEMVADRIGGELSVDESSDQATAAIIEMLDLPELHKKYQITWGGMDVGLTTDPSEILIFAEYVPSTEEKRNDKANGVAIPIDGQTRFKLLCRLHLERIPDPLQADVIMALIAFYRMRAFSLDKTGIGLPLYQELQKRAGQSRLALLAPPDNADADALKRFEEAKGAAKQALTVIKGYNFSAKVVVAIDEERVAELQRTGDLPKNPTPTELADKAGITRHVKDYATDCLRNLVDNQRLLIPWEKELINQWNGQTWSYSQSPIDAYGNRRRTFSEGTFHILDAGRMAAIGMYLEPIEALLKQPAKKRRPVLAQFGI